MVAAPSSGAGKTTVTCAILAILKNRGLKPVSFKCGPDFIDPMFHRTVLGIESENLDTFLAGTDGVKRLIAGRFTDQDTSGLSDCAVIEAVMGLYDGTGPDSDSGSSYEIAKLTDTPIILVVDAHGIGRTVISIIKGVLADDTAKLIKGVILNRMSEGFYARIAPVIRSELQNIRSDVNLIGYIPKSDGISIESRHLGLVLPGEIENIQNRIFEAAQILQSGCNIDSILEIMNNADSIPCTDTVRDTSAVSCPLSGGGAGCFRENPPATAPVTGRISSGSNRNFRIAVALDEAFCFYYPENLRHLERCGCNLTFFSPIRDRKLADDTDAILIGGGYPELYLDKLSSNKTMLDSIRKAIDDHIPSIAECGGFMYLHGIIEDKDKKEYEMVGAIDGRCTYTGHLVNFGYTQIKSVRSSLPDELCKGLAGMRGHEFHYYDSSCKACDAMLCKPSNGREYEGMITDSGRLWGWPHLYYDSAPKALEVFLRINEHG